ncbi:MAG: 2-oxoacid:ferredoxin oxidoreductase subunit gamma [Deltaproteobacteria bacterium]|nr:2-oxoacid:ferredoxin oxidoreductase subunit gamma [Deltaproteobacteria bacterium]
MQHEVVFAGFGGQGIMLAGQILAYSAMEEGFNVVWLPSYGPEMRGGTANCSVVVSDRPIASPIVPRPGTAVVMNNPSLERFGPAVKPGGCLIINSSLVNIECTRADVCKILLPANQMAIDLGSGKAANMVVLGAYVGATGAVSFEVLTAFMKRKFASKPQFVELNVKALAAGRDVAEAAVRGGS